MEKVATLLLTATHQGLLLLWCPIWGEENLFFTLRCKAFKRLFVVSETLRCHNKPNIPRYHRETRWPKYMKAGSSHSTVVYQWRRKTLKMGKANKKKKKNADFVKPKLKVGKRKPTATNFTNIAFKSSAINMLAQLEEKTEPTNRRNLSLKVWFTPYYWLKQYAYLI